MGRLSEQLTRHAVIGLDTAVLIYHFAKPTPATCP